MLHGIEFLHWLEIRCNRPLHKAADADFWSLYEQQRGTPLRAAPRELQGRGPTELLVVITTYRRPEACAELLHKLRATLDALTPARSTRVLVLNDQSDQDYGATKALARGLFGAELCWLDACARLGKPGFWRAYQTIFLAARELSPAHALFLQDDCSFGPSLLPRTYELWRETESDPARRVLYLFSAHDDEAFGRWVFHPRRQVGPALRKTQWFDLQAFFVDRAFFERLRYQMVPIHPNRWRRRPKISSGVGWQLTLRLRYRANIYQTHPALVVHGAHASEMNPGARARRPLDNRTERAE
ncbi:MAG: hypothetical protein JWN48_5748 [Myxococcaceae bacterium]|nr:hypothetical protein [Myxococcaceae bacterium]